MTEWILTITILCSGEPGCEHSKDELVTTEEICLVMEAHSDEMLPWKIVVDCEERAND